MGDIGCCTSLAQLLDSDGDLDTVSDLHCRSLSLIGKACSSWPTYALDTHLFESLLVDVEQDISSYIVGRKRRSMASASIVVQPFRDLVVVPLLEPLEVGPAVQLFLRRLWYASSSSNRRSTRLHRACCDRFERSRGPATGTLRLRPCTRCRRTRRMRMRLLSESTGSHRLFVAYGCRSRRVWWSLATHLQASLVANAKAPHWAENNGIVH